MSCARRCSPSCARHLRQKPERTADTLLPGFRKPRVAAKTSFLLLAGLLSSIHELTIAFRLLRGMTRTFLLAGLAFDIIFSPVNGLMPSRALVAGLFTNFLFIWPGMV